MNKKILLTIIILLLISISIYYIYFNLYGKPKQVILAEEQLKGLMKAPDTFKIDEVDFVISDGNPVMLIKYTASNSLGVPLRGNALYTYRCKSDRVSKDEKIRDIEDRSFNRIRNRINSGSQIEEPFEFCSLRSINVDGKELNELNFITTTANTLSLGRDLDSKKMFFPMSKIGGKITKLNEDGTIEAELNHYKYFPGKLFSWE